jgi:hypothetical protein
VAYRHHLSLDWSATVSARQQAAPRGGSLLFYRKIRIPDNSAVFRIQKTRQFREICIGTMHALRAAVNAWIKVAGT